MSVDSIQTLLREGWEGATDGSYFVDSGPQSGLKKTLAALSPEQASAEWGGNSVAAHAHHILFSLSASAAWISGDHSSRDWNESWKISAVDAKQWAVLQTDLGKGFDDLRGAIDAHANDPESVASALGAVAHVAYHLGAIRQKVAAGR